MPLILSQAEEPQSGHAYADQLGVSYEYPRRYRKIIRPGEGFIYYRPRGARGGKHLPQVYLGAGVVGRVSESGEDLLVCSIAAFSPFDPPVPFKFAGGYLEQEADSRKSPGTYFQVGVRRIDNETFDRILAAAAMEALRAG